ncbi:MAG: hypothetical protein QOH63_994 [Acidobacteriota bacterium]|jgi:hypothetical protein|nr:hypothetical protein [Acidobacteriota bacterium]
MRKNVFNLSVLSLLACSIIAPTLAQQAAQPLFPIVYGGKTDDLPEKLTVRGTISQVNYAPPRCGELIFAATFEIRLDGKLRGYNHPFLYLVVPCLYRPEGAEKFLGQHIEITATKQYEKRQPCFFDIESNRINSKGVPFYCVKREELLKSVTGSSTVSPVEFEGWLEEGSTYHALVTCDKDEEWRTVVSFRVPFHHAARIEWTNLSDFPQLKKAKRDDCQRRITFKVIARETVRVSGRDRWNTTYECKIIAVK